MKPQYRIVIPDLHVPFQDMSLFASLIRHIRELDPDGIDIIGDLLDCYTLSRFDKNPARKGDLIDEVDEARGLLEQIRQAAPRADIRFSEGNHENRLRRILWGKSKELAQVRGLNIPSLLGLDRPRLGLGNTTEPSLDIRYNSPVNPYRIGDLWFLHGDVTRKQNFSKSPGGRAAADVAKAIGGSVIMGHTHQMGYSPLQTWERQLRAWEVGCLCQFNLDYVVGVPPWQQGWAVVDFTQSGKFQVNFMESVSNGFRGRRHLLFLGTEWDVLPPAKVHTLEVE